MILILFGEHESRTEEPTDENIPLILVTPGRSTWESECEQETSFGNPEVPLSRGEILHKEYLVGEIYEPIGNKTHQRLEPNLRLFKLDKDERLYYRGKPLMNRNGELKSNWRYSGYIRNQSTSRDGLQHNQN